MSFPAIAIGGHLSVSVGDRLVCGVWRRAPSGEQASRPLLDSRQQPFCNFVSKVARRPGKGPHQTAKMGMKPRKTRVLVPTEKMPARRAAGDPPPETCKSARGFSRRLVIAHRFRPGFYRLESQIWVSGDRGNGDSNSGRHLAVLDSHASRGLIRSIGWRISPPTAPATRVTRRFRRFVAPNRHP